MVFLSLKTPNLPSKTGKKWEFRFMLKNDDRFQELIFSKLFNLRAFLGINRSFFLKTVSEKLMRFSVKNPVRFKNFKNSKVFKMPVKNDKNEKFSFLPQIDGRFKNLTFLKKNNLRGIFGLNKNSSDILVSQSQFQFIVEFPGRFYFLSFLRILNLTGKNDRNENSGFLVNFSGRL